jgi:transcriptional regulator with XRE-family HTH domain
MNRRIRDARQRLGLSQQELADRVRVSQPTIVHWEQGTHTPRHLALVRLADALGVTHDWLVGPPPPAPPPSILMPAVSEHPGTESGDSAVRYLSRPLVHVPVFQWPQNRSRLEAVLQGIEAPLDFLPVSMPLRRAAAFRFPAGLDAPAGGAHLVPGSLLVFEFERSLVDSGVGPILVAGPDRVTLASAPDDAPDPGSGVTGADWQTASPAARLVLSVTRYAPPRVR